MNLEEEVRILKEQQQKQGEIITDLVIRIAAVERLLIEKDLVSEPELLKTMETLGTQLMDMVQEAIDKTSEGENNE